MGLVFCLAGVSRCREHYNTPIESSWVASTNRAGANKTGDHPVRVVNAQQPFISCFRDGYNQTGKRPMLCVFFLFFETKADWSLALCVETAHKARATRDQQTHAHARPEQRGEQQQGCSLRATCHHNGSRVTANNINPSPRCRHRVCPSWCRVSSGSHHRTSASRMRRHRTVTRGA